MDDEELMRRTFHLAAQVQLAGSRPFAAVMALDGRVVYEGMDQSGLSSDPTAHPEIEVIRAFCQRQEPTELRRCTLYTNVEPCPMCAGAIYYSGVGRLVYSVSRLRFDEMVSARRARERKRYAGCRDIIGDGGLTSVEGPLLEEEGLAVLSAHDFPARWLLRDRDEKRPLPRSLARPED